MTSKFLNEDNWYEYIKKQNGIKFVLFVNSQSKICKTTSSEMECWFKKEFGIKIDFYLIDVFIAESIALKYRISIIPHLIGFQNGFTFYEKFGSFDKTELSILRDKIKPLVNNL